MSAQYTYFELPDEFDKPVALMHNGTKQVHIVDTRTFESHRVVNYDGYTANVGEAEALCGRDANGRMCPVDEDDPEIEEQMCQDCLNALPGR